MGSIFATGIVIAGCSFWQAERTLVFSGKIAKSDLILVENFDDNYLLFERASLLQRQGAAERIVVPTQAGSEGRPGLVALGVVEVMCQVARIDNPEIIAFKQREPIAYNVALQIRDWLREQDVKSIIVVAAGFRSRRTYLIYTALLRPLAIHVYCSPVFGINSRENWRTTWHGIQGVTLELIKLWYYELVVLRGTRRG